MEWLLDAPPALSFCPCLFSRMGAALPPLLKRRKLNLKAEFDSSISHFSFSAQFQAISTWVR